MSEGLKKLNVSLTKNGYLKLTRLISKYPSDKILEHLDEIKIDFTQARKMLAGNSDGVLPPVWNDVKKCDAETQAALLVFSIIFSHHKLITSFISHTTSKMEGKIMRNELGEKDYTNFAAALNKAGLAINFVNGSPETRYDLSKILIKNQIGPFAKVILKAQLENIGWKEPTKDDYFKRTFDEQIIASHFNKVLGLTPQQLIDWLNGVNLIVVSPIIETEDQFSVFAFREAITNSNLKYSTKLILRFTASLLTKPFVILTGLSGSGKTKLAQSFVQWICKDKSQYLIIPVGADWTNREPLLGYPNALDKEGYVRPDNGVLDLLIKANKFPNIPFFLILDEMNLSHVERYFADFLSVMESKEKIPLYAENDVPRTEVPTAIHLSSNLFIIGTVNVDETTNMFSPKVLDRANTIEFRVSEEEMYEFLKDIGSIDLDSLNSKGARMAGSFLLLSATKNFSKNEHTKNSSILIRFFQHLKKTGAEFGYRNASEIIRLINQLSVIDVNNELNDNEKLDIAILQKLLPKLHGSRKKLCPILVSLAELCVHYEVPNIEREIFQYSEFDFKGSNVSLPLSLEKITRMYNGAVDNGFASFAEA